MPSTTWHNLSEGKRERILLAAAAEFGGRGFSSGSLNVVARDAGVAKGSLFQYFEDKLDLFRYVADEMHARTRAYMVRRLEGHLASSPELFDVLRQMLLDWIIFHRENELERQMLLAVTFEPDAAVRNALRASLDQHFVEVIGEVVAMAERDGALREGASTQHLAAWVMTLFTHTGIAAISPDLNRFLPLHELHGQALEEAVDGFVRPLEGWYRRPRTGSDDEQIVDLRQPAVDLRQPAEGPADSTTS